MKQFLIAVDQVVNTLFGGYADETMSARAYRMSLDGRRWPMRVIDAIFFFDPNHCYESFASERDRKQLPRSYRVGK